MAEENTEIRNMNHVHLTNLINFLEPSNSWKLLMSSVTVDCDPTKNKKYTVDHIRQIELASKQQQRYCSEIFLEEWGTSGKIRPTLKILMELLYDLKLRRAADYIATILNDKTAMSKNLPEFDYNSESLNALIDDQLDPYSSLKNKRFDEITVPYESLYYATKGFSTECLIGAGGFGNVFKGTLNNQIVAVKVMDKTVEENDIKQYLNEIQIVLNFKHDNLLPLKAISYDVKPCVIYEFMKNGSLLDCIACENRSSILTWKLRIKLGTDVARGLVYLHTSFEKPYIHRDIKTANILIDNQMVAKIADFGLIRDKEHLSQSFPCGTSAYMAPEAHYNDISIKLDVFSFGIVLLELLTGLAPIDKNRVDHDLLTYIQGNEYSIEDLLDKRAGDWSNNTATQLYNLAMCCTLEKSKRPTMHNQDGVLEAIESILLKIKE